MQKLDRARSLLTLLQQQDYESKGWPAWLKKGGVDIDAVIKSNLETLAGEKLDLLQAMQKDYRKTVDNQWAALKSSNPLAPLFSSENQLAGDLHKKETITISEEAFQQFAKNLMEQPLPSKFEDPFHYRILLLVSPYFDQLFSDIGFERYKDVLIGTRPHSEINAQFIAVPDSPEFIIAFQHGLLNYIFQSCHVFQKFTTPPAQFLQLWSLREETQRSPVNLQEKIKLDATADMIDIIQAFMVQNDLHQTKKIYSTENWALGATIYNTLILPIYLFVFSHEYSHLILAHPLGQINWEKEVEADIKALQLCIRMLGGKFPVWLIANAIFLYFDLIEMLEKAKSIMISTEEFKARSKTHPYPKIRKELILEIVSALLAEDQAAVERVKQSYTVTQEVTDYMWERIWPMLLLLKQNGQGIGSYLKRQTSTFL